MVGSIHHHIFRRSRCLSSQASSFLFYRLRQPFIHTTLQQQRPFTAASHGGRQPPSNRTVNLTAIERNKLIVSMGRQNKADDILTLFQKEKGKFNNVNWATSMVQLSRIQNLSPQNPKLLAFVGSLADSLEEKGFHWFSIRQIVNVAHAIAKKKVQSPGATKILVNTTKKEHMEEIVHQGNPQEVANTAWACATLGVKSPDLFAAIDNRAEWLISEGTEQAVANTAWACATLGFKSPNLFTAIDGRAASLVSKGTPQAVANTAWACATLGVKSPKLFAAIEDSAPWLVSEGNPQNVANTAWACATLGVKSPKLFAAIEDRSKWLVSEGDPQEVANTAWACATLCIQSPNLFAAIEDGAAWLVSEGNPQGVANTAWACAILGVKSLNLFAAIEDHAEWLVSEGGPQDICTCCYALACLDLGKTHNVGLNQLWNMAMKLHPDQFKNEELSQLAQVFVFCQADGIELTQPSKALAQQLLSVTNSQKTSEYQKEVSRCLAVLGVKHDVEFPPLQGNDFGNGFFLAVDLVCIRDKVAIECDGPSHFLQELGTGKLTRCENGPTQAKRRFLEHLGWTVVNIDFRDWIEATKKKQQLEYLKGKLEQAGVAL